MGITASAKLGWKLQMPNKIKLTEMVVLVAGLIPLERTKLKYSS